MVSSIGMRNNSNDCLSSPSNELTESFDELKNEIETAVRNRSFVYQSQVSDWQERIRAFVVKDASKDVGVRKLLALIDHMPVIKLIDHMPAIERVIDEITAIMNRNPFNIDQLDFESLSQGMDLLLKIHDDRLTHKQLEMVEKMQGLIARMQRE